jgi:hypothetical protein
MVSRLVLDGFSIGSRLRLNEGSMKAQRRLDGQKTHYKKANYLSEMASKSTFYMKRTFQNKYRYKPISSLSKSQARPKQDPSKTQVNRERYEDHTRASLKAGKFRVIFKHFIK